MSVHSSPWIFTVYTMPESVDSTNTMRPIQRFHRCVLRRNIPASSHTASIGIIVTTYLPILKHRLSV